MLRLMLLEQRHTFAQYASYKAWHMAFHHKPTGRRCVMLQFLYAEVITFTFERLLIPDCPIYWSICIKRSTPSVVGTMPKCSLGTCMQLGWELICNSSACLPVALWAQVIDPDTFDRPTYAGNAIATVKYAVPGLRMLTVGTQPLA